MALVAYQRVSSVEQCLDRQIDAFKNIGVERVFEDRASGKDTNRAGLIAMLDYVRSGDVLYVDSLSRLARNVRDLLEIVDTLEKKEVKIISLSEKIDTATPMGRAFIQFAGILSELERSTMLERQKAGIDSAKRRGKHLGRPKAAKPKNWDALVKEWKSGKITATAAIAQLGMTRTTFYKLIRTA
jgi:DNA invertase Pin-like site-specific DNA recombinase